MDSSIDQALAHICINDTCYCDWRLSIHGCEETRSMMIIYIIHITLSGINIILGLSILYNRLHVVGFSLFSKNYQKQGPFGGFFLKIRPLECLLTFVLIYCLLRIMMASLLIADIKINIIFQSWITEFCWQVAYIACSLYLIGIVQLLTESNETLFKKWLPGKITNILGYWIFFSPLVLNNSFAILAGVFAVRNQQYLADLSTRLLYLMWVKHCTLLMISVIYAGARLIKIMNNYLSTIEFGSTKYSKVKFTIFRIRITIILIFICMLGFAIILFFYFLLRIKILTDKTGSIILDTIWNLFADIIIIIFNIVLLISPDGNNTNNNNISYLKFMNSDNNQPSTENYEISQLYHYQTNNKSNNNDNNKSHGLTTSITMTETIGDLYIMDNDSQEDLVNHLQKINNHLSNNYNQNSSSK